MKFYKGFLSVAVVSTVFCTACPPPTPDNLKDDYKMIPSAEFKIGDQELNIPPEVITVNSIEYKPQYVCNFNDAEKERFTTEWNRPTTNRRSSYWIPDTVYVQDDVLNVTTVSKTGSEIDTLLKKNLGEDCYEKGLVRKPADGVGQAKSIGNEDYWPITGAALKAKYDLYGLYVARISMHRKSAGHWMAYWFYGSDYSPKGREIGRDYEFDMLEYHQINTNSTKIASTTHWPIETGSSSSRTSATKDIEMEGSVADWHIFALLWTPEEVVYYVDWKPVSIFFKDGTHYDTDLNDVKKNNLKKTHEMICPEPLQMHFSNEVGGTSWMTGWAGSPDINALKTADNMKVDWYVHYTTDELKAAANEAGPVHCGDKFQKYGDYVSVKPQEAPVTPEEGGKAAAEG